MYAMVITQVAKRLSDASLDVEVIPVITTGTTDKLEDLKSICREYAANAYPDYTVLDTQTVLVADTPFPIVEKLQ